MTDPMVCVPSASAKYPARTPAAEPLLEPPGVCRLLQGLRVAAGSAWVNSVVAVMPITMAPASRNRVTRGASSPAKRIDGNSEPQRMACPLERKTSQSQILTVRQLPEII